MEKVAIIDMGSNSIRFIIMGIADNHAYRLEYQHKESIRLGRGMNKTGKLSPEGKKRALECLHAYRHMMEVMGTKTCIAVATAAAREATDGREFIEQVEQETGIHIEVISGEREAELGFLGTVNTMAEEDFVLFDLGGASVEITLVKGRRALHSYSVPLGAVTMTDKYALSDKPDPSDIAKCRKYVQKKFEEHVSWVKDAALPIIGIGGTARTFAKMDQAAKEYQLSRIHNYIVEREDFYNLAEEIQGMDLAARKKLEGLSSDRADLITAGSIIMEVLMRYAKAQSLVVSGCGLRDGVFYEYYGKKYGEGAIARNVLARSVHNYLDWQDRHMEHLTRVHDTTLSLYDQLQDMHGYGPRERQLLGVAAWLHDSGKAINYYDHARHSAFIIAHAPLYGMRHKEQLIASFIAGFHHGISGKIFRAYRYASMLEEEEWRLIRKLAVLLALAEASDVTYEGTIKELRAGEHEEAVTLSIVASDTDDHGSAVLELRNLAKSFKKEYGKPLLIVE